ncbi:pyridoxamine 5'-phosphate oxidase family protein [Myxococcaceae bacterium JPH2]|nr:pyridoxamine 5'-phosphate oxidase family protein [Myxococcaceae bacterium JPH2]
MASQQKDPRDALDHLDALIQELRVAMMTTVEEDGSLRARPMWTRGRDAEGALWLFTREHASKVGEVTHDHHVNLSYADAARERFVSLSGRCQLVLDKDKARALWNPALQAWFPQGLDDPELALLKVSVEKAEYWDASARRMVHWAKRVRAAITGHGAEEAGDNARLTFDDRGAPIS